MLGEHISLLSGATDSAPAAVAAKGVLTTSLCEAKGDGLETAGAGLSGGPPSGISGLDGSTVCPTLIMVDRIGCC